MNEETLFPAYISRPEEQRILGEAVRVRAEGHSRVVLLYGQGGTGKTSLVRRLTRSQGADPMTVWVEPVDIDDSDYWLLSNLELHVAKQLDPDNTYFQPYLDYLSRFPRYTQSRIGYETVVSHLARIKQEFVNCYRRFVADTGKTVVICLDTVEAIRGMYLLVTLTQWMKALPSTLLVLSGRPPLARDGEDDQIKAELEDPHQSLLVTTVRLGQFTWDAALEYLDRSIVYAAWSDIGAGLPVEGAALSPDELEAAEKEREREREQERARRRKEQEKIVHLTRGHPLWLAFAIDYLSSQGVPKEVAETSLAFIKTELPYQGNMSPAGLRLHEEFKRRLVAPYRATDFWHEGIRRLAVVRESTDQAGWWELMADRLPADEVEDMDRAWEELLQFPWIRPRANRHYVTLHDAVAEELAQRIIPVHDRDRKWRRQLWSRAEQIYRQRGVSREAELSEDLTRLDEDLNSWSTGPESFDEGQPTAEQRRIIAEAAGLEPQRRELSKVKAVQLYYQLLSDFPGGCQQFLDLMAAAKQKHDILSQNLLAGEIQRFLPGGPYSYALGDAVGEGIDDFHRWLSEDGRELHLEIGLSLADYLIKNEQPDVALKLLEGLPGDGGGADQRNRLSNLRGNACMRIEGRVMDARDHFEQALTEAASVQTEDRLRLIAKAHKELGFYYRNMGMWQEADKSYEQARDAVSDSILERGSDEDREEMASIQTNWAYLKGLTGYYHEEISLVQSAITVRRKLGNLPQEGNSWSVIGEVYRYQRRYQSAWGAYAEAERIFQELRNWAWLGLVYQEQAVCVVQAAAEGIDLVDDDAEEWARRRIKVALDLCRDLSVRAYPSALNRAGRIFGTTDCEVGLQYLTEGIDSAKRLYDGWFWFANLIEHAELCYRAWVGTDQQAYRDRIFENEDEIGQVMEVYAFPDLKGRWDLLRGHVCLREAPEAGGEAARRNALNYYKRGFILIAQRHIGSSGAASITGEFETLGELMEQRLSPETRKEWLAELRRAWSGKAPGSTLLLARLEELY
jgi:tetratricopeptide (TPR) repeat protein